MHDSQAPAETGKAALGLHDRGDSIGAVLSALRGGLRGAGLASYRKSSDPRSASTVLKLAGLARRQALEHSPWRGEHVASLGVASAADSPLLEALLGERTAKQDVVERGPGEPVGALCAAAARELGLPVGLPLAAARKAHHAWMPAAGVAEPSTLVIVLDDGDGHASAHLLNSRIDCEALPPGVARLPFGLLPGYVGYELDTASAAAAHRWMQRWLNDGQLALAHGQAANIAPGCDGLIATRRLRGGDEALTTCPPQAIFKSLNSRHTTAHQYRALLEAVALDLRLCVEQLRAAGVPVRRFVAVGALATRHPLLLRILCQVLGRKVLHARPAQGIALGAAVLGAIAAGEARTGHRAMSQAVKALTDAAAQPPEQQPALFRPAREPIRAYDKLAPQYAAVVGAQH